MKLQMKTGVGGGVVGGGGGSRGAAALGCDLSFDKIQPFHCVSHLTNYSRVTALVI